MIAGDTLVPSHGQIRTPKVIANCFSVVIDGDVGKVVKVRHPCVGDPHVQLLQQDIYLSG
jgi:hypothetical protein